jgi:tetratricopeptide (TPR) repeat protein
MFSTTSWTDHSEPLLIAKKHNDADQSLSENHFEKQQLPSMLSFSEEEEVVDDFSTTLSTVSSALSLTTVDLWDEWSSSDEEGSRESLQSSFSSNKTIHNSSQADLENLLASLDRLVQDNGSDHPGVAQMWNSIGNTYYHRHEVDHALDAFQEAAQCSSSGSKNWMNLKDAVLSGDDDCLQRLANLADAYSNIATIYWKEANIPTATEFLLRSLQAHQHYNAFFVEVTSADDSTEARLASPSTSSRTNRKLSMAAVLHQLGLAWTLTGDYGKAEKALHQAYAARMKVYKGKDHVQIAQSLDCMGTLSFLQGDYKKALHYHEQALSVRCSLTMQGTVSEGIVSSLRHISGVHSAMGDHASALFGYRAVLSMQKELLLEGSSNHYILNSANDRINKRALRRDTGNTLIIVGDLLRERNQSDPQALDAYQQARYFLHAAGLGTKDRLLRRLDVKKSNTLV